MHLLHEWEGCNLRESEKVIRVLQPFGSGIKHGGFKFLLNYAGLECDPQIIN